MSARKASTKAPKEPKVKKAKEPKVKKEKAPKAKREKTPKVKAPRVPARKVPADRFTLVLLISFLAFVAAVVLTYLDLASYK